MSPSLMLHAPPYTNLNPHIPKTNVNSVFSFLSLRACNFSLRRKLKKILPTLAQVISLTTKETGRGTREKTLKGREENNNFAPPTPPPSGKKISEFQN